MKTETRKTKYAFSASLFLSSNFLTDIEIAHAVIPTLSITSTISNGVINPIANSAFNPAANSLSNTLTITVPDP